MAVNPKLDRAFMTSHPAHLIALGLGSGLAPFAPGTFGTLAGWLSFVLLAPWLNDTAWAIVIGLGFLVGLWCCRQVIRALGVHDHPAIVWDEILAFWLILWVAAPIAGSSGAGWVHQLVLFGLFRFFDAVKPPPISWLDRNVPGGLGVMLDDLAAAIATLFVYAASIRFLTGGGA